MSQAEMESSEEIIDDHSGVILGCWDHEKTVTLIQDLEHSVSLVERKCRKLFDELKYYKSKYLMESEAHDSHLIDSNARTRKLKTPHSFSESEKNITLRNNFNTAHAQGIFEKKFQEKLHNINEELREAALKMGLKDNVILQSNNCYQKVLNDLSEDKPEIFFCDDMHDNFKKLNFFNDKSKSDSVINGHTEFSRITKNELELYKKLSRAKVNWGKSKRKKLRKLPLKRRQILRFCCKKKTTGPRKNFPACKVKTKKPKPLKNKRLSRRTAYGRLRDSVSRKNSEENFIKPEADKVDEFVKARWPGLFGEFKRWKLRIEGSQTFGEVIRQAVPFTTCTSTSKSYNVGLNMQQLHFLSKHGRKPKALVKTDARSRSQTFEYREGVQARKNGGNDVEKGRSKPTDSKSGRNGNHEMSHMEGNRKVWELERSQFPNFRKVRCRYTGSSSDGYIEYHKSTTSQCINGRGSMIKSESKAAAYSVGSKIMLSDCRKTHVFQIGEDDSFILRSASGDGICGDPNLKLHFEWSKFLCMYRFSTVWHFLKTYLQCYKNFNPIGNAEWMFTSLKGKLPGNCQTLADVELKSMESEIDFSIGKYKDFLQFYSKFLHLNHCLKSIKKACETEVHGNRPSLPSNSQRKWKMRTYTPNSKTAMREVQTLQDKIRLVNH